MNNSRYFEIDSTYRDRNKWPYAGEFDVLISQSGSKGKIDAVDPVSLATPEIAWRCNNFAKGNLEDGIAPNKALYGMIATYPANMIAAANSPATIIMLTPGGQIQTLTNYYKGAVLNVLDTDENVLEKRRIIEFSYISNVSVYEIPPLPDTYLNMVIVDNLDLGNNNYFILFEIDESIRIDVSHAIYTIETFRTHIETLLNAATTHSLTYTVTITADKKYIFTVNSSDTIYFKTNNNVSYQLGFAKGKNNSSIYNHVFVSGSLTSSYPILSDTYDRSYITIEYPFTDSVENGAYLSIIDPSDVKNISRSLLFVPNGLNGIDAYNNYYLYNESYSVQNLPNPTPSFAVIKSYDPITRIIQTAPITYIQNTNFFCIRKVLPLYTTFLAPQAYVSNSQIYLFGYVGLDCTHDYIRLALQKTSFNILPPMYNLISRIIKYEIVNYQGKPTPLITFSPPFPESPVDYIYEILPFSYDNANPFVYSGSMVSQQEEVCYEIRLLNLILPNQTLATGQGSRIAYYPYVYVELSTISSPGSGLRNTMYSNNPNSTKMLFRAPVTDVADPNTATFINLYGDDMVQTVKMKINDNFHFSVRLQNGDIYNTVNTETYSPYPANPKSQVTAMFSFRRI